VADPDRVLPPSLVPWLTLTAYFHLVAQLTTKKSTSQDFMLMVTGALIIFATAVTRGGLAQSVHAFGSNPIGYLLLVMMGIIIFYYLSNKSKKGFSYFEFELKTDTVYDMSISLSFISIVMIAVISLWGIVFPIINSGMTGGDVSIDAAFFNKWTYPFVLLFLVGMIGCNLYEVLDIKKYSATIFGAVILGVAGVIMNFPDLHRGALHPVPPLHEYPEEEKAPDKQKLPAPRCSYYHGGDLVQRDQRGQLR